MENGRQTVTLKDGTTVAFEGGAHAEDAFVAQHLGPYFVDGTITPYPGADFYAVCYGELYAYTDKVGDNGHHVYLAVWSTGVPDCAEDVVRRDRAGAQGYDTSYAGSWEPVKG